MAERTELLGDVMKVLQLELSFVIVLRLVVPYLLLSKCKVLTFLLFMYFQALAERIARAEELLSVIVPFSSYYRCSCNSILRGADKPYL